MVLNAAAIFLFVAAWPVYAAETGSQADLRVFEISRALNESGRGPKKRSEIAQALVKTARASRAPDPALEHALGALETWAQARPQDTGPALDEVFSTLKTPRLSRRDYSFATDALARIARQGAPVDWVRVSQALSAFERHAESSLFKSVTGTDSEFHKSLSKHLPSQAEFVQLATPILHPVKLWGYRSSLIKKLVEKAGAKNAYPGFAGDTRRLLMLSLENSDEKPYVRANAAKALKDLAIQDLWNRQEAFDYLKKQMLSVDSSVATLALGESLAGLIVETNDPSLGWDDKVLSLVVDPAIPARSRRGIMMKLDDFVKAGKLKLDEAVGAMKREAAFGKTSGERENAMLALYDLAREFGRQDDLPTRELYNVLQEPGLQAEDYSFAIEKLVSLDTNGIPLDRQALEDSIERLKNHRDPVISSHIRSVAYRLRGIHRGP